MSFEMVLLIGVPVYALVMVTIGRLLFPKI